MDTPIVEFHLTPDSSQIHSYAYDPAAKKLLIRYKSNHQRITYGYPGATPEDFAALHAAESKGSHVKKVVKAKWPTRDHFEYLPGTGEPETAQQSGADAS